MHDDVFIFFPLFYAYHYYLRFTFKIRFFFSCYYNKRGGGGGNNHLFGPDRGHELARDRDRSTAAAAAAYMRPRPRLANDGIYVTYIIVDSVSPWPVGEDTAAGPRRSSHGQEVVRRRIIIIII